MSSRSRIRITPQDIHLVQKLIERCLQQYMDRKEAEKALLDNANIHRVFTETVWQMLEEENPEFFKVYYSRLVLKEQIKRFNTLLEKQVQVVRAVQRMQQHVTLPPSDGSHIPASSQDPVYNVDEQNLRCLKPEDMQHPVGSRLLYVCNNGGSSLHACMPAAVDISPDYNRINGPSQCSNMDPRLGDNGGMINLDSRYSGCPPYTFGADGNVLEPYPTICEALVPSFSNVNSNLHPLNGDLFEILGQIHENFSPSDLIAPPFQSSGIQQSYSIPMSAFLATSNGNLLQSGVQDNNRLDPISEGLIYEGFRKKQISHRQQL